MAAGRSSSYADRISREYEQRFGRPADASDPAYGEYVTTALPAAIQADKDALARSQGRWHTADKFAWGAVAAPFVAAAAPAIAGAFGAGGAASLPAAATEGIGFSAAPVTGGGMTLGSIFGSRGFEAAVNAGTSLFGARAQNKANRYATDANSALMARQIAMEEARIKAQQDADAADRLDAQRRWDAEQAFQAKQFAATEEERAYNRKLLDDREARRAVYRPYSERAMRSLGALLGIG